MVDAINTIESLIERNKSLASFNTLAIPSQCDAYAMLTEKDQLPEFIQWAKKQALPWMILGGGSNTVLADHFEGLVIHNQLRGIDIVSDGDDYIVTAQAGEVWDDFVRYCLSRQCYGLENLILIPGLVGAAPIQNIGAYGVELCDSFICLQGWNTQESQWQTLDAEQCQFSYRDSIFKRSLKDKFVITSVSLRLSSIASPKLSYPSLRESLDNNPSPEQVANAVEDIRRSKLPDPVNLPNAGSFFKNPIVDLAFFEDLKQRHPELVYFPQDDGRVKLAAGWLIESCGWKGHREKGVGVHEKQALVLVNYEQRSADAVLALAANIQRDVGDRFNLQLEVEPRIYQ